MKMFRRYLAYLWRHKKFVYREGRKLGVGRWRLLIHDWSKFSPTEFWPYARFFYGPHTTRPKSTAAEQRAVVPLALRDDFDRAWLLHQNRQNHHFQHWVLIRDDGSIAPLEMPMACRREMLADWKGAGMAVGKPDTRAWYLHNRGNIMLAPQTRRWIEDQLGIEEAS